MRFMMIVKATPQTEAGALPDESMLEAMGKYNEELSKAGVLLALDGLQPSAKGARIRYSGDKRTVVDGPFTETKELIAGFWLIDVKSKEEAVAWALRAPNPYGEGNPGELELRQVFELEDFGPSAAAERERALNLPGRG